MDAGLTSALGGARRGSNLPRVADYNQMLVLGHVRRAPEISRVELVERTGLSVQTVSNITRKLLDAGLIRKSGRVSDGPGAPRAIFEVEASGLYSIGLHIDPARLTCVILDLAGNVIASSVEPAVGSTPQDLLRSTQTVVESLLESSGVPIGSVAGLGVATPGPIDATLGTVVGAPNLPGWEHVHLRRDLEALIDVPVVIEKDSTAAALGEVWITSDTPENLAFIYLGTGIAAGFVLDGEITRGASSNIGDIGHLSADPDGPLCYCGGRGCLSATGMPALLVDMAASRGVLSPIDVDDAHAVEVALATLGQKATEGHADATEILDRAARGLGRVAGQLANTLDLNTVVFGGPQWGAYRESVMRVAPQIVNDLFMGSDLHTIDVRATALGDHAGAVGSASLAMWLTTFDAPRRLYLQG